MSDVVFESSVEDFDKALSRNIAEQLVKHYPGYTWCVHISSEHGIGRCYLAEFSLKWGYSFKLDDISHDPSYKIPVTGCGEILERLSWPRSRNNEDIMMTHKVVGGTPIFDYHASKNCKIPAIVKLAYDKLR